MIHEFPDALRSKPPEPFWTPAEREEMRQFQERKANAVYLGWPKPTAPPVSLQATFAAAYRRKAAAKREEARLGTSSPDGFPHVVSRTPEATLALLSAESFDAIADDLEQIA